MEFKPTLDQDLIDQLAGATQAKVATEPGKTYRMRMSGLKGKICSNGTPMLQISFEHSDPANKYMYGVSKNIFRPQDEEGNILQNEWSRFFTDKAIITALAFGAGVSKDELGLINWAFNTSDTPNERGYVRADLCKNGEPLPYGLLRGAEFLINVELDKKSKLMIKSIRLLHSGASSDASEDSTEVD